MASQNDNSNINPMLLDGDIIIIKYPINKTAPIEAFSSLLPTASSIPFTPSLIETIPLRRFSYMWNYMPDPNPQIIYKDTKGNRQ